MTLDESLTDLVRTLGALSGQTVWKVNANANTGPDFSIKLGKRVPLKPNANPAWRVTEDGEYSLFVRAAWRLNDGMVFVCGSDDDVYDNDLMVEGLARLIGKRIMDVVVSMPGLDLTIRFDDELRLSVFCDRSPRGESLCYSLGSPDSRQHLVSTGGTVVVDARSARFAWPG